MMYKKMRSFGTMMSLVLTASMISGCSIANPQEQIDAVVDSGESENSDTQTEEQVKVDTKDGIGSSEHTNILSGDDGSQDAPGFFSDETGSEKEDNTDEKLSSDQSVNTAYTVGGPTYKLVTKEYSIKYDGDVTFPENNENSKDYSNGILFEGVTQSVLMDEEWKDIYPELYKTLYDQTQNVIDKADGWANSTAEEAKAQYEDSAQNGYSFFGPFENTDDYSIKRSDNTVLSIYCFNYEFTGGAHGIYGASGQTFDVESGKELDLGDVVTFSEEQLNEIILSKLHEIEEYEGQFSMAEDSLKNYRYNAEFDVNSDTHEYKYIWYMAGDGIHIIFNVYEIASYADGMQDIVIGYEEYPGLVESRFIPEENTSYCRREDIPVWKKGYDSDIHYIHYNYYPTDYDDMDDEMISAEDLELVMENGSSAKIGGGFSIRRDRGLKSYRVGTPEGREYIYVIIPIENDYYYLNVFDITDGSVTYVGDQGFHYLEESIYGGFDIDTLYSNPDNMHFGQVLNSLGTYTCYGSYKVGKNGMPELVSKEFHIAWKSEEAYSKTKLSADIVGEDGTVLQSGVTLPVGTHVIPYKTDGETYIDCKLDDDRIVRFTYTSFEYPASLKEGEVDELFEGLQYAG
ncbi:Protein of unknown function [Butyrivibrio sp. ob235]|uniref:DUF3298 and DUF4163 domain-containing protein n=1 Tax=Butyrivibrio sp. ob235 TaxID=1761780 RepID=UPI0008AE2966|nr:DUF3298 and DUF4163 domain-containing protein [Butyrivibrio sp. ob235]SEL50350.1 Protein of unknown function [Butyrivibrio sp. ob235]